MLAAAPLHGFSGTTFSFDVPVWPAVWPFRASLWRPDKESPWRLLQVTVDVIAAAGLPPLFSAKNFGSDARSLEEGGTPSPAVLITEGAGTVAASVMPSCNGRCVVRREGQADWELAVKGLDAFGSGSGICVRRNGQDIALSTLIDTGSALGGKGTAGTALQFDVQPEAHSTDAALLLTCMLAAVVFHP